MKEILALLSCCAIVLATNHVSPSDIANTVLHVRHPGYTRETLISLEENTQRLNSRSLLQRRGKKKANDRSSSVQGQSRARPNPKANVQATGRADIHAFNPTAPGNIDNIERRLLTPGQQATLHTEHRVAAAVVGKHLESTPPNAEQQPISEHPLKAEAQGRVALGNVVVPPGGRGYIKKETPAGIENIHVLGGTTVDEIVQSGASDANKISLSVTGGGRVQAGGHASFESFIRFAEHARQTP